MRCGFACAVFSMTMLFMGCGGNELPKLSSRADVAGTVDLDGQPLAKEAEIFFSLPPEPPAILPIAGGKFEGKAPVGDVRVEVRAYRMGEPIMMNGKPFGDPVRVNFVAEEFNDKSTLKATIPATGAKELKFEVRSKK